MLSVGIFCYVECRYAEFHYAECRGAKINNTMHYSVCVCVCV